MTGGLTDFPGMQINYLGLGKDTVRFLRSETVLGGLGVNGRVVGDGRYSTI